jgi:NADH-quinone oxidoreductase subunit J
MISLSDYIGPRELAQAAFWFTLACTMAGGLAAVLAKNIFHNVLGLALCMFGVAGVYLYLGSQFVAMMQLLIYVGAIVITIVFAIMLSPPLEMAFPKRKPAKVIGSLLLALLIFGFFTVTIYRTNWIPANLRSFNWSIKAIGVALLSRYILVFEMISLLLVVAIIGAIVIAGRGRGGGLR